MGYDNRETVPGCPVCWDLDDAICNFCGSGITVLSKVTTALRKASAHNDNSGGFDLSESEAAYYAEAVVAALELTERS